MASAILSSVLSVIANLETQSSEPTTNLNLRQLKQAVLRIQPFLHDAELREAHEDAVKSWLHQLRLSSYETEDALDDYQLQFQEVHNSNHLQFQADDTLKFTTDSLNDLAHQCISLNLIEGDASDYEVQPLHNIPSVEEIGIYGREDDKKRVLELLLSNPKSNLSVVSVVGIGGVGKTTIADLVYNDPFVCQHFDARGWVHVPQDINLLRLMGALISAVTGGPAFYLDDNLLQSSIQQKLQGKRFLLVLDDFCNHNESLWEAIKECLTTGLKGSVVLVTTRDELVARNMQTVPSYRVECLSEKNYWSLFRQCAFGSSTDEPNCRSSLAVIGMRIAKKLKGLPLATKMVGSLLAYETDEKRWQTIWHNDLFESSREVVDIISPSLTLSYQSLPTQLKRCFVYFALFPKGYLFKRDSLVRLWMAEGFIHQKQGKRIEDVGNEYFDELLRRSFFQYSQGDREAFVMHDLVHDLAHSISGKETCKIQDGDLSSVPSEVRVLSLIPQHFDAEVHIQSSKAPKHLRTFMLMNRLVRACAFSYLPNKKRLHLKLPNDMFINMKSLRTLDLSETVIEELPDSISNLKYLRLLALNHTRIRSLPDSICSLFNLQTLELRDCYKLQELPRGLKNLSNLRCLTLPGYSAMVPLPAGVGLLTNLQTLSHFLVVEPFHVDKRDQYALIADLKGLVHLRGELEVSVKKVTNIESATGVLKDKEFLTSLRLSSGGRDPPRFVVDPVDYSVFGGDVEDFLLSSLFGDNSDIEVPTCEQNLVYEGIKQNASGDVIRNSSVMDDGAAREDLGKSTMIKYLVKPTRAEKENAIKKATEDMNDIEENVFQCLQPHTNLRELVIDNYFSVKFPSWLGDPSYSELVSIKLNFWSRCKVLPPLGQLPFLKHLVFWEFSGLENVGREFYGENLTVTGKRFPSLETLYFKGMYEWVDWNGLEEGEFPCLDELILNYCPKLTRIPCCFPTLKKLVVWSCDQLRVLPILPSLTSLGVRMHRSEVIFSSISQPFYGLQSLEIKGCNLSSLAFQNIYTLTELKISNCRNSESSSFTFAEKVSKLASLKLLEIYHCPDIRFSANMQLPSTLQLLDIFRCPFLEEWCHGDGISNILQIPTVVLDGILHEYGIPIES